MSNNKSFVDDDADFGPSPVKDPSIPEGQMTIEDLLNGDLDELSPPIGDVFEDTKQYLEDPSPEEAGNFIICSEDTRIDVSGEDEILTTYEARVGVVSETNAGTDKVSLIQHVLEDLGVETETIAIREALESLAGLIQVETSVKVAIDSSLGSIDGASIKEPVLQYILTRAREIAEANTEASVFLKVREHVVDVGSLLEYLAKNQMTADQFISKFNAVKDKAFPNS